MKGCDYSWDHPDLNCLKSQGVGFIVRYGSRDPSKNLTKGELDSALAKGLAVAVVWQEGKTQMLRGYSGGQQDARDADSFTKGLGLAGIPVYYSCDFDPGSSDWGAVDAYLDGTISVTGLSRNGMYGGKPSITREFDRGKIKWGWQTYAWSGSPTQWDSRAQLRQTYNDVLVCGGKIDWDESKASDFGQWPRPSGGASVSEDEVAAAFAFYKGKQYHAYINSSGKVCINGGVVDQGSNARSMGGLDINPDNGQKVISFINTSNHLCTYHQNEGDGNWYWTDKNIVVR